jgi:hypothetical protein
MKAFKLCKTPGLKMRSKGMGRGLARGKGRGPMGVPFRAKLGGGYNFGGIARGVRQPFNALKGVGKFKNVGF